MCFYPRPYVGPYVLCAGRRKGSVLRRSCHGLVNHRPSPRWRYDRICGLVADLLLERDDVVYWPTHGTCINDPQNFVRAYITHRRGREAQLIERLKAGDRNIKQMVETIYADVDKGLHPAAALSALAHMQDLTKRGVVSCDGQPGLHSDYHLAE